MENINIENMKPEEFYKWLNELDIDCFIQLISTLSPEGVNFLRKQLEKKNLELSNSMRDNVKSIKLLSKIKNKNKDYYNNNTGEISSKKLEYEKYLKILEEEGVNKIVGKNQRSLIIAIASLGNVQGVALFLAIKKNITKIETSSFDDLYFVFTLLLAVFLYLNYYKKREFDDLTEKGNGDIRKEIMEMEDNLNHKGIEHKDSTEFYDSRINKNFKEFSITLGQFDNNNRQLDQLNSLFGKDDNKKAKVKDKFSGVWM